MWSASAFALGGRPDRSTRRSARSRARRSRGNQGIPASRSSRSAAAPGSPRLASFTTSREQHSSKCGLDSAHHSSVRSCFDAVVTRTLGRVVRNPITLVSTYTRGPSAIPRSLPPSRRESVGPDDLDIQSKYEHRFEAHTPSAHEKTPVRRHAGRGPCLGGRSPHQEGDPPNRGGGGPPNPSLLGGALTPARPSWPRGWMNLPASGADAEWRGKKSNQKPSCSWARRTIWPSSPAASVWKPSVAPPRPRLPLPTPPAPHEAVMVSKA